MYQPMLSQNRIKSIRSSKNAVFAALVAIGAITLYNQIVTPHVNYLRAAQRYESVIDELARKNQTINNNVTAKKKELEELLTLSKPKNFSAICRLWQK
jgi:hypothetical protein